MINHYGRQVGKPQMPGLQEVLVGMGQLQGEGRRLFQTMANPLFSSRKVGW